MSIFPRLIPVLVVTVVTAQAQLITNTTVVTNYASGPNQTNQFRTADGYGPNFGSLDGTPTNAPSNQQWQTTDPYDPITDLGATSQMQYIEGWTSLLSPAGNKSVLFGGYAANGGVLPAISNPSLYYDFSSVIDGGPNSSATYTLDFGFIANPTVSFTNKDIFSFGLLATNGDSLASFSFNPFTSGLTNGLRVQWEQNGTNVVSDGSIFNNIDIQYGALYRMTATVLGSTVDMSIAGLATQTNVSGVVTNYAVVTNVGIVTGGALSSGYTAADFERASIDWELTSNDPTDPGSNYLLINSIAVVSEIVSIIPEPGTWATALLLLGGAAYAARRRSTKEA
jgi:hypothetical protein